MREIVLSKGYVALVDDADFERVNAFSWFVMSWKKKYTVKLYAARKIRIDGKQKNEAMHNFLLGRKKVDHKDGYGLNNQRANLRPFDHNWQNGANRRKTNGTSRFKGVYRFSKNLWRAKIAQRHICLCRYEVDAAQAYNFAAEELYGEFALLNTPETCQLPGVPAGVAE